MIVYIYKNNLCDPARNVGAARQFSAAEDVDAYINMFVASLNPKFFSNWRIFIADDCVEFSAIDHYVLIEDAYGLSFAKQAFEEVNIKERARHVNLAYMKQEKARNARMAKAITDSKS